MFDELEKVYGAIDELVHQYHPEAQGSIYFDSTHITIKSILDGVKQSKDDLEEYMPFVAEVVDRWASTLGHTTTLFAQGLFTNLHRNKSLSLGIRFFPSQPLIQMMRGDVGDILYSAANRDELPGTMLRNEDDFHTRLTHSTGYRARDLDFPLHPIFVRDCVRVIERFYEHVFGKLSGVSVNDVYIRNGESDRLALEVSGETVGEELCVADYV